MWPFSSPPTVPVLRFTGPIGIASPLRPGLSIGAVADAIERAFSMSKLPTVAVVINSPGGSAVQSHLIYLRLRQLAEEKKKRIIVFCEDVAASGGYFLAVAGDEIYADPSSIVGSIGVISATFGFDKAIAKLGVDRRVYTAGQSKSVLDPFQPEKAEDVARIKAMQEEIHAHFIAIVKGRRGDKLKPVDGEDLFSGAFWAGRAALERGLIDGLGDMRSRLREMHGEKVRLRPVSFGGGGLLARFRRMPGLGGTLAGTLAANGDDDVLPGALPADALATAELRGLWSRFGL